MRAGRWLLMIFAVCFAVVATLPGVGAASTLSGLHEIMEIYDIPVSGSVDHKDVNGVSLTLNGKPLRLVPTLSFDYRHGNHILGGYVRLMSGDGQQDYLSFPVEKFPRFRVYKFQNDVGQEYLLMLSSVKAVTDSACRGLWVVGGYGSQYVTFATLDAVSNAGLLYEEIVPSIENGELRLLGVARDRDCRTYDPQTGLWLEGLFKGHPVQPHGIAYCQVNWISLFWNSDAQWFGIRRAN